MDFHLYVHFDSDPRVSRTLDEIVTHVQALRRQGDRMETTAAQMKQALIDANTQTNEIANDIADLKAKLAGGLSDLEASEVQGQLDALVSRLTGVAAEHTPATI